MIAQLQHQIPHSPPSDSSGGRRFSYFISAPTSPSRASEFYRDFDDFSDYNQISTEIPDQEFAFHVDTKDQDSMTLVSASELFDHGIIRSPLAPVANRAYNNARIDPEISAVGSAKSKGRKSSFWSNFTPKKKKHSNPYARVAEDNKNYTVPKTEQARGRERGPPPSTSRRVARSLSPVRGPNSPMTVPAPETETEKSGCRKWRLRNFLLFRSASEGRASDKDPMRKITSFYRRFQHEDQIKASTLSSRAAENGNKASTRRVSAHERHYTVNRAASDDLKKKTFLPYKQGILGRMAVNPTVHHLHTSTDQAPECDHVKKCLKL